MEAALPIDIREPSPDDIHDPPRDCVCGSAAWQAVSSAQLCDVVDQAGLPLGFYVRFYASDNAAGVCCLIAS